MVCEIDDVVGRRKALIYEYVNKKPHNIQHGRDRQAG
jgi:hypothetical protein